MRIEIAKAKASVPEYARAARRGPVLFTRQGRPEAVLVDARNLDWEDWIVSTHPRFIALMQRSYRRYRPGTGIPLAEIEREFGLKPRRRPARRRQGQPRGGYPWLFGRPRAR